MNVGWEWSRQWALDSISWLPQRQKGLSESWKLCLSLCLWRSLKPTRRRVITGPNEFQKFWFNDNKTIKVKNTLLKFVPFFNHLLEERVFEKVMIYANLGHVVRVSCSVKTIWYRDSIEKVHHPKTGPGSWTWEKTEPLKSRPIGKDWPQRLKVLPLISFYMKDTDDVIHFR